jgi:hypothetical protein
MELSEEQINTILERHKQRIIKSREKYQKVKDTEEFKMKNREQVKKHYYKVGKEQKKEYYNNNKELIGARQSYYYYKSKGRLDDFKTKQPEKYKLLVDKGIINENVVVLNFD